MKRYLPLAITVGLIVLNAVVVLSIAITEMARGLVVFEGDSLTSGPNGAPEQAYPAQAMDLLGGRYVWRNRGGSGQTLVDMARDAALIDHEPRQPVNILVLWGGTNDLRFGASADEVYSRIESYARARRATGYRVLVLTILPRSNSTTPEGFEIQRQALNARLRASWRDFADMLIDVAADPRIGDAGDELDARYFTDRLHMTPLGYSLIAAHVAESLKALLP